MSITITVSDTVGFKVKGTINNPSAVAVPFEFTLVCQRLDQEEFSAAMREGDGLPIAEFMVRVVKDWSGVKDTEGKPVPFSEDALRKLCLIPGVASIMLAAYTLEAGAKAKN